MPKKLRYFLDVVDTHVHIMYILELMCIFVHDNVRRKKASSEYFCYVHNAMLIKHETVMCAGVGPPLLESVSCSLFR